MEGLTECLSGPQCRIELVLCPADPDSLAGGEPVDLDDARRPGDRQRLAVGTPAASITSFANDFEPSMRAAAALGPKTAIPR